MTTEKIINTLRDVIARRRVGLPLPSDVDIDELLEEATEELELLAEGVSDEEHCDTCSCDEDEDDDEKPVLAAATALRERLSAWVPAT